MSLNSALFGCFETKKFWVESQNIPLNSSTFSVGDCRGQPMLLFWKLVDETQILKPPEPTIYHDSKKKFDPSTPQSHLRSFHYETPCSI